MALNRLSSKEDLLSIVSMLMSLLIFCSVSASLALLLAQVDKGESCTWVADEGLTFLEGGARDKEKIHLLSPHAAVGTGRQFVAT